VTVTKQFAVAVVGASGLVGEALISLLEERAFPVSELHALASDRSLGRSVSFRGRNLPVAELTGFDFSRVDLALFCAGAEVARAHAPRAAATCLVIDGSGEFSAREDVPLVVAEVNGAALEGFATRGLIASPDCSTIELVLALKPLHDEAQLARLDLATYQAVSGSGRAALEELARESIAALSGRGAPAARAAAKPLAFNCIPQVDAFESNGYTREETRLVHETRRLLGLPQLGVHVTAVSVPVFYGHCAVAHLDLRRPLSAERARKLLENAPGVTVLDQPQQPGGYPTAATEAANRDTVYVGRIREDLAPDRGLNLWIVADNVRRGAALNSVQIAEALARRSI
jgi:aspartate-semialdehyde dehydrogenase